MPVLLSNTEPYPVILEIDKDKSPAPTFYFKPLTARQAREIISVQENALKKTSANTSDYDLLFDTLKKYLTGWQHLPIEYDPAELDNIINLPEAFELLGKIAFQGPDSAEKKG